MSCCQLVEGREAVTAGVQEGPAAGGAGEWRWAHGRAEAGGKFVGSGRGGGREESLLLEQRGWSLAHGDRTYGTLGGGAVGRKEAGTQILHNSQKINNKDLNLFIS